MSEKDGIPDRIWLQAYGDESPESVEHPINIRSAGVTWCWEPIFDYDVEYVRAQQHDELVACLRHLLKHRGIPPFSKDARVQYEKAKARAEKLLEEKA